MASEQSPDQGRIDHFKYSKRTILKSVVGRPDGGVGLIGRRVVVGGWVKSARDVRKVEPKPQAREAGPGPKDITCVEVLQTRMPFLRSIIKAFGGDHKARDKLEGANVLPRPPQPSISFLQINDGSCVASLRVMVDSAIAPPSKVMPTGTCILAEGILQSPSLQDNKEVIELKTEKILHIGTVDQDRYPLSRKRLPLESLRDQPHFRPRTTTVASVMRIRHALTQATHTFFQENGFLHVQVPVITTTNCGGPNKSPFLVTTSLDRPERVDDQSPAEDFDTVKLEIVRSSIQEKARKIEELKRSSSSSKEVLAAAINDLKKTGELASQLETKLRRKAGRSGHVTKGDHVQFLTVSGRMHLESYASALGNVYTFGPTFLPNGPDSKKLLAEMWMAELEMAFSELQDSMDCAIDFLKFVCKWILDNCTEDLKFMSKRVDKFVLDRLESIVTGPFEKISYTEAVGALQQVTERKFETRPEWGVCLCEEHESCLTDEIYKKPLVIYNHPKELKPFNARMNEDGKTAASFDIIVPKVGTLIRGSQSEDRFKVLSKRVEESGSDEKQYEWYLELRKHGNVKCSGFTFVFDPLVLYATGLNDARDAVPFPTTFDKAKN